MNKEYLYTWVVCSISRNWNSKWLGISVDSCRSWISSWIITLLFENKPILHINPLYILSVLFIQCHYYKQANTSMDNLFMCKTAQFCNSDCPSYNILYLQFLTEKYTCTISSLYPILNRIGYYMKWKHNSTPMKRFLHFKIRKSIFLTKFGFF